MKRAFITVDVEQDCPPYLSTVRGIKEGMPKLLKLLAVENISATFFVTGKMAEQFPDLMRKIITDGHELGCHGHTHKSFNQMSYAETDAEIQTSAKILRQYAEVTSFRAPYLDFPEQYLGLLSKHGFALDSSVRRFNFSHQQRPKVIHDIYRVPTVFNSHKLRTMPWVLYLFHFKDIVFYTHPWEFIDLSNAEIPRGCRTNTGDELAARLKKWVLYLKSKHYDFRLISEY